MATTRFKPGTSEALKEGVTKIMDRASDGQFTRQIKAAEVRDISPSNRARPKGQPEIEGKYNPSEGTITTDAGQTVSVQTKNVEPVVEFRSEPVSKAPAKEEPAGDFRKVAERMTGQSVDTNILPPKTAKEKFIETVKRDISNTQMDVSAQPSRKELIRRNPNIPEDWFPKETKRTSSKPSKPTREEIIKRNPNIPEDWIKEKDVRDRGLSEFVTDPVSALKYAAKGADLLATDILSYKTPAFKLPLTDYMIGGKTIYPEWEETDLTVRGHSTKEFANVPFMGSAKEFKEYAATMGGGGVLGKTIKVVSPALKPIITRITNTKTGVKISAKLPEVIDKGFAAFVAGKAAVLGSEAYTETGDYRAGVRGGMKSVGEDAAVMAGFGAGFAGKIPVGKSPIKYEDIKIDDTSLYKGISIERGEKAQPLIGKTASGKLTIGMPKVSIPTEKMKSFVPLSATASKVIMGNVKLAEAELMKSKDVRTVMSVTKDAKSAFIQDEFIKQTKTLSEKGIKEVVKLTKEKGGMVYGSFTAEAQMPRDIKTIDLLSIKARVPGDIDVQLKGSAEEAAKAAKKLTSKLRALGEDVRISKQSPTLIETSKGHHAVDIHARGIAGSSEAPEMGFGFEFAKPTLRIQNLESMSLSEQGLRKGSSSIGLWPEEVGPARHRTKDILDFISAQKVLIASMKRGTFSSLRARDIKKAEAALKRYEASVADKLVGIKAEGVKVPLLLSPSRSGALVGMRYAGSMASLLNKARSSPKIGSPSKSPSKKIQSSSVWGSPSAPKSPSNARSISPSLPIVSKPRSPPSRPPTISPPSISPPSRPPTIILPPSSPPRRGPPPPPFTITTSKSKKKKRKRMFGYGERFWQLGDLY